MGILDFFKSKQEDKKVEKVRFDEFESFLKNLRGKKEQADKIIVKQIKIRLNQTLLEFKEEILGLKNVDLSKKKVEERIKLIVQENLKDYIYLFGKLIENLEKLENISMEDSQLLIRQLDELFIAFDKKSKMSYEKSTFLIGKEFEKIKDSTRLFFRDVKQTLEDHKQQMEGFQIISLIEKGDFDMKEINSVEKEIEKSLKDINENIKKLELELRETEKKLKNERESKEYIGMLQKEWEFMDRKDSVRKEIFSLRALIDFKVLQRIYHSSEKRMLAVNEMNGNFYDFFKRDNGKEVIQLVEEAKLDARTIKQKIENINANIGQLNELEIGEDKTLDLVKQIEKLKEEIGSLSDQKTRENKKKDSLELKSKELFENLRKDLLKFNIELN
jgi:hypothetical protein